MANPSFYLSATISPLPTPVEFNDKYARLVPSEVEWDNFGPSGHPFVLQFTRLKGKATVFTLNDAGRLESATSYSDHFAATDFFGALELVRFFERALLDIDTHTGEFSQFPHLVCTVQPPSGRYAGGFQELQCQEQPGGSFNLTVVQYCPFFVQGPGALDTAVVIGTILEEEFPVCYPITWLMVPVCD